MPNMKAMINIDSDRYTALLEAYPEIPVSRRDPNRMASEVLAAAAEADDWQYYRFYSGAVNTGYTERKFALSPTLGISRPITVGEFYSLPICSKQANAHGPVLDPLSADALAARFTAEAESNPYDQGFDGP